MEYSKGFSLLEVLLSLMLVMTLALGLLEQRIVIKSLINQIILYSKASNILDQTEELIQIGVVDSQKITQPFELKIQHDAMQLDLEISWLKGTQSINRYHRLTDSL